jgi:hypothetical protein
VYNKLHDESIIKEEPEQVSKEELLAQQNNQLPTARRCNRRDQPRLENKKCRGGCVVVAVAVNCRKINMD